MSPPFSGSRIIQARNNHEAGSKQSSVGFVLGLFSDTEDGSDIILPNLG
jgi:hypothetical protein